MVPRSVTQIPWVLQVVYDALISVIGEEYPEVHFDSLPPTFPPWLEVANLQE